jgi:Na+-transporting methylmalonyl-CoA/oxaloacetate decarboxylase gamma subunit
MADEEPKGSFVRWQAVTIGQLTYAINLILGFSVATLGFQVTLLLEDKFTPIAWQKCAFGLSLLLLVASVIFGITVVINRLRAFRATMRTARAREKKETESTIEEHRQLYRKLDGRTWCLFWWQIGTFAGGIVLTVLSLLAIASHKLF